MVVPKILQKEQQKSLVLNYTDGFRHTFDVHIWTVPASFFFFFFYQY